MNLKLPLANKVIQTLIIEDHKIVAEAYRDNLSSNSSLTFNF